MGARHRAQRSGEGSYLVAECSRSSHTDFGTPLQDVLELEFFTNILLHSWQKQHTMFIGLARVYTLSLQDSVRKAKQCLASTI